jgi:hypothetical protein
MRVPIPSPSRAVAAALVAAALLTSLGAQPRTDPGPEPTARAGAAAPNG